MKHTSIFTRRAFLKKSGTAATVSTFGGIQIASAKNNADALQNEKLSNSSRKFMELFDLKYPIVQAAPGGEELAIAIANAGAMGSIQLAWSSPEVAFKRISRLNAATDGNYYANFVLHREPLALDKALEAGCPTVQFSWGIPRKEVVAKIRAAGAKLGIQVSSRQNALMALEHAPDFLICQGLEAGGHLQATSELYIALDEVLKVASGVPVLASGGISTGHDIRAALQAGAAGTILGTRFMATVESDQNEVYKKSVVEGGKNSTVYTNCFNREWNAMHRVLRNKTFWDWEAAGCPLPGSKPGEEDVLGTRADGSKVMRYSMGGFKKSQGNDGKLDEMVMYAGQGTHKIKDVPRAADLIKRLWAEFEDG